MGQAGRFQLPAKTEEHRLIRQTTITKTEDFCSLRLMSYSALGYA